MLKNVTTFFSKLTEFLKAVAKDERIPSRDKKLIAVMIVLIISPVDFIPDWIPVIGLLDDLFIFGIVMNYFFEVLDSEVLLSHYPWGMKSFIWIRRYARFIGAVTPSFVQKKIWSYSGDIYRK